MPNPSHDSDASLREFDIRGTPPPPSARAGRWGLWTLLSVGWLGVCLGCKPTTTPPPAEGANPYPPISPTRVLTGSPNGRFDPAIPQMEEFATGESPHAFKILHDFSYVDPQGKVWTAKAHSITDGASIPSVFWVMIGSPFDRDFLKAAIVHDYYCEAEGRKHARWEDVHKMFHHAALCCGASKSKAGMMYYAVYRCGPRWDIQGRLLPRTACITTSRSPTASADPSGGAAPVGGAGPAAFAPSDDEAELREVLQQLETFIESGDRSLDEIAAFEPQPTL